MSDNPFADAVKIGSISDVEEDDNPFAGAVKLGSKDEPSEPTDHSTTRYGEDRPYSEAAREYGSLTDDPNYSSVLGQVIHTDPKTGKKTYVPAPEPDRFSLKGTLKGVKDVVTGERGIGEVLGGAFKRAVTEPTTKVPTDTKAVLGAAEMVGDIARTGAAAVDYVAGTDLTEETDKLFPEVDTSGSVVDSLIADGIPMLLAGGGTAGAASKILANAPKIIRGLGVVLSGETVMSAGTNTDEGTLFVGKDAMLPIFDGLDLGDEASEKVLEHRLNVLSEGLLLGAVGAGAYQVGRGAVNLSSWLVAPLTDLMKKGGVEAKVYRDISLQLANLPVDAGPEQIAKVRDNIAEVVEKNKTVVSRIMGTGDEEKEVALNTLQSLIRGTDDVSELTRLETVQAGKMKAEFPNFMASQKNVAAELQSGLDDQAVALGGDTITDQSRTIAAGADQVAEVGRVKVSLADDAVDMAEQAYETMKDTFYTQVRDDLEFGSVLEDLSKKTGISQGDARRDTKKAIMNTLEVTYSKMKETKDSLYKAVSGGEIDGSIIVDAFDTLNTNQILPEIEQMNSDPLLKKFVRELQPKPLLDDAGEVMVNDLGEPMMESAEDIGVRISQWISDNDDGLGEFGFLYQKVRPQLSALANNLYGSSKPTAGAEVRSLVRMIDDDLVDEVARTSPELADAAKAAKDYYQKDFAPFFRSPGSKLTEYSEIYDSTIGHTGVGGDRFAERGYLEQTDRLATSTLNEKNPAAINNLKDLLNRPEAAGATGDSVADYYVYDMLEKFGDEISIKGSLEDVDLTRLNSVVREYQDVLATTYPEKAAALDNFLSTVNTTNGNLKEQADTIKRVADVAKETRQNILRGDLQPFFAKEGMDTAGDTYGSFKKVFSGDNPVDKLNKLREHIGTLPPERQDIAERGLKTAFNRFFKDQVFTTTKEVGGVNALSTAKISRADGEVTQLFELADQVFKDSPEVPESLRQLTVIANNMQSSRGAKPNASWSPTSFSQDAMKATNRMIYTWIGPLSRPGTRIRSIASGLIEKKDAGAEAVRIMDRILTDADYFVELTRKYNKAPSNPELQAEVARWFSSAGVKVSGDDTSDNPEEPESDTARMLKDTASNVRSTIDDEMRQLGEAKDLMLNP